jgi:hypothetical protein
MVLHFLPQNFVLEESFYKKIFGISKNIIICVEAAKVGDALSH